MIASSRFVVISGCSGGGKSTLLKELARRGHATVPEPGRRIVQEELAAGGTAQPWSDLAAFLHRAIALSRADLESAAGDDGWVFFDRGLIDAAGALEHLTGVPARETIGAVRYHERVFLAPPWPEIHVTDAERRHGFEAAAEEYERLSRLYPALGYETIVLPKRGVEERADFVLDALSPGAMS